MMASQSSVPAATDDHAAAAATSDEDGGGDGVLPLRLVREILVRLRAKPLCRLRAVCRSWRTLLSSDGAFAAAHASRHPGPLFAVAVAVSTAWGKTIRIDMVDASGRVVNQVPAGWWRRTKTTEVMVRTAHHLAAVAVEKRCLRLRVVNLASGVVSFVPTRLQDRDPPPRPSAPESNEERRRGRPPHRFTGLVLGRAASGEHKAVRVRGDLASQTCEVVTISRDGRWRERQAPPAEVLFWTPAGFPDAAVVGGTAYFLVDPYRSGRRRRGEPQQGYTLRDFADGGIAAFDLAAERWSPRLLGGPPSAGAAGEDYNFERKSHVSLAALNGRLVVVHRNDKDDDDDGDKSKGTLDMWFRTEIAGGGEDGEAEASWSRRYAIPYEVIMADDGDREAEPLWEMADGRLALWVWQWSSAGDEGRHGRLRMFNPAENKCVDVLRMSHCLHVGVYTGGMLSDY